MITKNGHPKRRRSKPGGLANEKEHTHHYQQDAEPDEDPAQPLVGTLVVHDFSPLVGLFISLTALWTGIDCVVGGEDVGQAE